MALLSKKAMNFAYGMGAAIVIIGALFKITHIEFGFITGNLMLTIGLVTEALIFGLSAFEPVDDEYDWSLVYPELAGGMSGGKNDIAEAKEAEGILSRKLDELLKENQSLQEYYDFQVLKDDALITYNAIKSKKDISLPVLNPFKTKYVKLAFMSTYILKFYIKIKINRYSLSEFLLVYIKSLLLFQTVEIEICKALLIDSPKFI